MEERIETAGKALNSGLVDIKHAVDMLFLDSLTDEEKAVMVQSIKIESGVPISPDEVAVATELLGE
jgi:hypothetical protein